MSSISSLVRPNIAALTPYSTARDEHDGRIGIFLDANESPFNNGFNRYPDPHQAKLKARLAAVKGIPAENIFLGNGSDEAIDLVFRIFCEPGKDNAVIISPSYGMYGVAAAVNDVEVREVRLEDDFSLDAGKLLAKCDARTKAVFLCSPNNPSGNAFPKDLILGICDRFKGIVVVDEAYIDFCREGSLAGEAAGRENLIVLQTLSKARAMAGLRIGLAMSSREIIGLMSKVKYPYNLSSASIERAMILLEHPVRVEVETIISERERLFSVLRQYPFVGKVFPSEANFLLARVEDADGLYSFLLGKGIIVRNRSGLPRCEGCLRLTVGLPAENESLLRALDSYAASRVAPGMPAISAGAGTDRPAGSPLPSASRLATVSRKTSETDITLTLDLDGKGPSGISTGLRFFDHMLDQIPHHGGVSLAIDCKGDLDVDEHHTMEDVGIALGEAIDRALGSKAGIERYGFMLPMDECKALVLIDFGGRTDFQWEVRFTREYIGDTPTEMFPHFFKSLCSAAHCNLRVEAEGENNHHLAESIFKAFARALKQAVRRDGKDSAIPSSKGML